VFFINWMWNNLNVYTGTDVLFCAVLSFMWVALLFRLILSIMQTIICFTDNIPSGEV